MICLDWHFITDYSSISTPITKCLKCFQMDCRGSTQLWATQEGGDKRLFFYLYLVLINFLGLNIMLLIWVLVLFWIKKEDMLHSLAKSWMLLAVIIKPMIMDCMLFLGVFHHWMQRLSLKDFVWFSNHEALNFLEGQNNLNQLYAPWVSSYKLSALSSNTKPTLKTRWLMPWVGDILYSPQCK